MIDVPIHRLAISQLLLLINQLFLSSNETTLQFFYDTDTSSIATEILNLNNSRRFQMVIYKINADLETGIIYSYENSLIISTTSMPPFLAASFFDMAYIRQGLNQKSKHLCIMNGFSRSAFEVFISFFRPSNVHVVPLARMNDTDDFIVYNFQLPSNPFNREIFSIGPSDTVGVDNMHELLFSLKIRNNFVVFSSMNLNPPYVYQVQDFGDNAETYIGGIEVRMMELLEEKWNWNVQVLVFNYTANSFDEYKIYRKFNGRIFRTILPQKHRHSFREIEISSNDMYLMRRVIICICKNKNNFL